MVTQSQLRFGKELEKLQISDIETLINNKVDESHNLEYKKPSGDLNQDCNYLAKTISGFLNTDGGILVYGVAEKKQNKHFFPTDIKWCVLTKERLENLLKSSVQPWEEKTKIHRIRSEENEKDGIFVIEVPKSNRPPHMFNYIYYHRLNFQTEPMSHWNVYRSFQTSWIRGRELNQNVIEPLYSEIKIICEKIREYRQGKDNSYRQITTKNRYLYDQIEASLQEMIDAFYNGILELNRGIGWSDQIARDIINKELAKVFKDEKDWIEQRFGEDHLLLEVRALNPSGRHQIMSPRLNRALLMRKTPEKYLQSIYKDHQVLGFEPYLRTAVRKKIPKTTFDKIWLNCEAQVSKNKTYISLWDDVPKLLTLGKKILEFISGS